MADYASDYTGAQFDKVMVWGLAFGADTDSTTLVYPDTYWKDHIIELSGVNPPGAAGAATADPDGEGWLFAGVSADTLGVLTTQINHDCKQGAGVVLKPHLHVRKTTDAAGAIGWKLEWKAAAPGGDFGSYAQLGNNVYAPIAATTDNNTAARHLIYEFGDLTLTVALSTMIVFKLTRVASVTASDTYGANALAMSFDFHYPVDSPGSAEEYTK